MSRDAKKTQERESASPYWTARPCGEEALTPLEREAHGGTEKEAPTRAAKRTQGDCPPVAAEDREQAEKKAREGM